METKVISKIIYRIKKSLSLQIEFAKFFFLFPFACMKYRNNEIYLVSERGTDARDNGFHMFQYIRQYLPEKNCIYVISPNSPDYRKVAALGKTVNYRSLQHYLLFIAAKYKISTHLSGCSPAAEKYTKLNRRIKLPGYQVFLQHGVIYNNLVGLYKENANVDVFICGAKPEYEYVMRNFHYQNEVHYTGLARYDALHNFEVKEYILIMPTWRVSLRNLDDESFTHSDYYHQWQSVLNDPILVNNLIEKGYKLVFYPHYEFQKFAHLFSSSSENVLIAEFENYDVQTLLKEAQLLITDYSSVFFDFAYMGKPCVYFQFDKDDFFLHHYHRGYFDYETMGFGEVETTKEDLVSTICDYIMRNFEMKEKYKARIRGFFPLNDEENCARIFKAIEALE